MADWSLEQRLKVFTHLSLGDEGNWVENDIGKTVEVVNLCGGRFLMTDEHSEICGLTDSMDVVMGFLMDETPTPETR